MELKAAGVLYTLATVMITFAGFSALLLAIRQAAGARVSVLDRFLAKTVLTQLFVLTAGALLPPVLALYDVAERSVWLCSAILFGVPMLGLLTTYPHRRRVVAGNRPPRIVLWIFVVLGAAVVGAMLIDVVAGFGNEAAAYVTALTINFLTTAFAFVAALDVIMRQPTEPAP